MYIDESSDFKGIVLSGTGETTHIAVLKGTVIVDEKLQPRFNGSIIYADQKTISTFLKSRAVVDNIFNIPKKQITLLPGNSLPIKANVIE